MPEGLSPEQNDEASNLGQKRSEWGNMLSELQSSETEATTQAESHKGLGKLRHLGEVQRAKARASLARSLINSATAGHDTAEQTATEHFQTHEESYIEQAKLDAVADGVSIETAPPIQARDKTGEQGIDARGVEPAPAVGLKGTAEAAEDGPRSTAYRIPIAERPALIPRAEQMLADAETVLTAIQSGQIVPAEGIHEGWENAMRRVERAQQMLVALKSSELDKTDLPKRYPADRNMDSEPANRTTGSQNERVPSGPNYIKEMPRPYSYDPPAQEDKFRPHANEVAHHMLTDPNYAHGLETKKDFGRNRTDEGISEIMAAYALPYLQRAERAEARGWHDRAEIYRKAGSDAANYAARAMMFEDFVRAGAAAGVEVSIGSPLVKVRPRSRPRDMMRSRGFVERRGLVPEALFKRS
jgi:hypothetical protein